jgi:uncharacterized protein YbjT (DUF2867 family)
MKEAQMRVAVAGGTGLVGGHVVRSLRQTGHEAVVISKSTGADAITGEGLRDALSGVNAVVDVTNTSSLEPDEVSTFFTTVTSNLLEAESELGVGHHVLLSIVGVDRGMSNPHYRAKRRQEQAVESATVPWTILRATQFFEFAEMVVGWTRDGDAAAVPPLLIQPAAATDVAAELARLATSEPLNDTTELGGPRREDLLDMTRRILTARGESLDLQPDWQIGPFDTDMAGDVLLPGPDAKITTTDLGTWLR